jgi:hypothetical protein
LTAGNAAIGWALRLLLHPKPARHTLRQATLFVAMPVIARSLSEANIDAVAAYYGELSLWPLTIS